MRFNLEKLVRPNIQNLKPYSSARSEFSGGASVLLDANENAFGSPAGNGYNRYPDPLQGELKRRVAEIKGISPDRIFVGNGSDEAIDLLIRIFCEPGRDTVITCPPTYGMYGVAAAINNIEDIKVLLTDDFQLDVESVKQAVTPSTKLIFICSPNNPTGNLMCRESVIEIAKEFEGIVIVDEAYIDFAAGPSFIEEFQKLPNIVVLQTFSKAWGMAGLRVGLAFASIEIIDLMSRVKPPYNVSGIAQCALLNALNKRPQITAWVAEALKERARLVSALSNLNIVEKVYPSDANFVLAKVAETNKIYQSLIDKKVVVRNRNNVELCGGCLRITIGTPEENQMLLNALKDEG
ncbi:MAG: histidinol-phosphate transaminase [Acidobacteria bacterium]|nr:histidinol-phosphate transaminase [Acidobacteriota bacterium]